MRGRFIELGDICHLNQQASGEGVFADPLWRESYYFNMTDPNTGFSLITTIGLLPNKRRKAGVVFLIRDGEAALVKPLIEFRRPAFNDSSFQLKGLRYSIDGAGWNVEYRNGHDVIDLRFTPINKVYPYMVGEADGVFQRIGSQHLEQSGVFKGTIRLRGEEHAIGPAFGHRDHSWGIRDWAGVDRYRLFCCAFSRDLAVNLWTGSLGGNEFVKGYVFDGGENRRIVGYEVRSRYVDGGHEPAGAEVRLEDEGGREYRMECSVVASIPIPFRRSVMYETVARMRMNGKEGHGLLEYLYRTRGPAHILGNSGRILKLLLRGST